MCTALFNHNLKSSYEGDASLTATETRHQEEAEAGQGPEHQGPVDGEGRGHPPDHLRPHPGDGGQEGHVLLPGGVGGDCGRYGTAAASSMVHPNKSSIQSSPARMLISTRRRDHIAPVLHNLHRLPVQFRIHLKILPTTYKVIHNLVALRPRLTRCLRSMDATALKTPRTKLRTWGDRPF